MRVLCIGGGPAGLYLALLLKKADARNVVRVVERNRPGDTFGWGVVFSDQTLDNLAAANPETARDIADSFNHWDDIDVHFKGRTITSGGHGFCGIGRKRLLNILQAGARRWASSWSTTRMSRMTSPPRASSAPTSSLRPMA
jgi:anthraniloyl-CoA monooxygenase